MMSSSSAMEGATTIENDVEKESLSAQQEIQVELESEMKNGGQEGEVPIGEVDNLANTTTSENANNLSNNSYRLRGNSNQGEMERRAEERLLDERIRERYRREIGAMPAKLSASQRQLLALYRRGLRGIRSKPESSKPSFYLYLRQLFRAPFGLPQPIARRDFGTLDYFQRATSKTLDNYFTNETVKQISLPNPLPLPVEKMGSARCLPNGFRVEGQSREGT